MGQLPILGVDGLEIPQSAAILRYLALKFGFAGKTPEDRAWVDAVVDRFKDFFVEFKKFLVAKRGGKSEEEVAKVVSESVVPAMESYFKLLNGLLERSKSGFLIGNSITYADLVVVNNLETLRNFGFLNASEQPKLTALLEKVYSQPGIKEYVSSRTASDF